MRGWSSSTKQVKEEGYCALRTGGQAHDAEQREVDEDTKQQQGVTAGRFGLLILTHHR